MADWGPSRHFLLEEASECLCERNRARVLHRAEEAEHLLSCCGNDHPLRELDLLPAGFAAVEVEGGVRQLGGALLLEKGECLTVCARNLHARVVDVGERVERELAAHDPAFEILGGAPRLLVRLLVENGLELVCDPINAPAALEVGVEKDDELHDLEVPGAGGIAVHGGYSGIAASHF